MLEEFDLTKNVLHKESILLKDDDEAYYLLIIGVVLFSISLICTIAYALSNQIFLIIPATICFIYSLSNFLKSLCLYLIRQKTFLLVLIDESGKQNCIETTDKKEIRRIKKELKKRV